MIFLRQKHFTSYATSNRRAARASQLNRHNINNSTGRIYNRYPSSSSNHLVNPANLVRIANPQTTQQHSFNTPSNLNATENGANNAINNSSSHIFNERLASVTGLFGVLSIVITGALLYAIFTVKSEDKWYYIIG
jgi:hypothetical protein